jgi:L-asparaginase
VRHRAPGRFSLHNELETRIVVLRLVPGFLDLDALVSSEIRGVVLMLYGESPAA